LARDRHLVAVEEDEAFVSARGDPNRIRWLTPRTACPKPLEAVLDPLLVERLKQVVRHPEVVRLIACALSAVASTSNGAPGSAARSRATTRFPSSYLPGEKEPDSDGDIGLPEALTAEQKGALVAFLKRL
jgi:hypothetical protein